jgi:energy-coupling factor transporter ATP-binding protein EcfA2
MPSKPPPIGIRSIEIENFRRIESLRLEFLDPIGEVSDIAVLAGPNGSGKTSVLEACLLALEHEGDLQATKVDLRRSGEKSYHITAEVDTVLGRFASKVDASNQVDWTNLQTHGKGYPGRIPSLYFSSWRAPKLVGALPISAGKSGQRPRDNERNRVWRAKQFLIDSKAHSLMSQGTLPFENFPDAIARLDDIWALFHPGQHQRFSVEPVNRDPLAGFDVFLCNHENRRIPVDALSSGQLELFAFFGGLLLAKFESGVIVIDEPELHLDPQWHALMIRAIRQFLPQVQLIVATHSPQVYDSVLSFQRHLLVEDSDPRAHAWEQRQGVPTS